MKNLTLIETKEINGGISPEGGILTVLGAFLVAVYELGKAHGEQHK